MPSNSISFTEIESETLRGYIQKHIEWSRETFGEGHHLEGLLKHIEKECNEVRGAYYDATQERVTTKEVAMELVDIIILSVDALWRLDLSPELITAYLMEKQRINKGREYPKITDPNQPTEHVREKE